MQAIQTVLRGDTYLCPAISATVVDAALGKTTLAAVSLTPRERQVLQLIAESNSNKDIARQLNISIKSVESHRGNLMKKLDMHTVAGLVRYAINIGLVQP